MFKIDNKKYLIAVSGGPDSMALLDMTYQENKNICVAHLNYHKRDSAKRDEMIVYNYCLKRRIPFFKKDVSIKYKGNFQEYARVVRYKFFKKIIKDNNLDAVLVAHHLDDLIETYLMQDKRGGGYDYYGLKEETFIYDVKVKRPLLEYTKEDLLNYCQNNNLEYGIDESNLKDDYTRNKIRHSCVSKMNKEEKNNIKVQIDLRNKELLYRRDQVKEFINDQTKMLFSDYLRFEDKEELLRQFIKINLSEKYLKDLIKQLNKANKLILLLGNRYFVKEYDYIEVFDKPKDYSYIIDEIKPSKHKYFKIKNKGDNFHAVTPLKEDYPLTIRNFHDGDFIKMRYGTKKINRFFIDKKISYKNRLSYPVVLNKNNEVILVPGIGCASNRFSYNQTLYVLELLT